MAYTSFLLLHMHRIASVRIHRLVWSRTLCVSIVFMSGSWQGWPTRAPDALHAHVVGLRYGGSILSSGTCDNTCHLSCAFMLFMSQLWLSLAHMHVRVSQSMRFLRDCVCICETLMAQSCCSIMWDAWFWRCHVPSSIFEWRCDDLFKTPWPSRALCEHYIHQVSLVETKMSVTAFVLPHTLTGVLCCALGGLGYKPTPHCDYCLWALVARLLML